MKQRSLIKSQIIQAWNECINEDYYNQRINTERSLQAAFTSHLNQLLSRNRRLFIEPGIVIDTKKDGLVKLVPDVVVCNTKEVISVIELNICLYWLQFRCKSTICAFIGALYASNKPGNIWYGRAGYIYVPTIK